MSSTAASRPPARITPEAPRPRPVRRRMRPLAKVGIALAGLVLLAAAVGFVPNETIRRSVENRMNSSLEGYSVTIGRARLQPIGLSLTLSDLVIRQDAHPEPAILQVPRLHASVHWKELLFLRVVADFAIDRPVAYVNLPQLRSELADRVPVQRKGWQQAVEAIYPLKINVLRISDGKLTYVDEDPKRPLELTDVQARATNIRNIHSKDRNYPSPIEASAVLAKTGKAEIRGNANFLAEPYTGVTGAFRLSAIPPDSFKPAARHFNVLISGGTFSGSGDIEFAPKVRDLYLPEISIEKVRLGYVRSAPGAPEPGIVPASQRPKNEPSKTEELRWNVRLDRFRLV